MRTRQLRKACKAVDAAQRELHRLRPKEDDNAAHKAMLRAYDLVDAALAQGRRP